MNMKWMSLLLAGSFIFNHAVFAKPNDTLCPTVETLKRLAYETITSRPPVAGLSIAISNPLCGDFVYTWGEANIEKHIPLTDETKLPIASNTKPILIALALMIIEENPNQFPQGLKTKITTITDINGRRIFSSDGKVILPDGRQLDLTDPDFYKAQTGKSFDCKKDSIYHCPELDIIDLYHLLLESSGLSDDIRDNDLTHQGIPDLFKDVFVKLHSSLPDPGSFETQTDLQMLKKYGVFKLNNPDPIQPAQSHNVDALLLAIILERTTDKSLNDLLIERILKPLNLDTNSMHFVTRPSGQDEAVSRRYVYLNTDEEIDQAIVKGALLSNLTPTLARLLKPSVLSAKGRHIVYVNERPAIDILDLHGQGFIGISGAGGMVAQPKAYVHFYHALVNGSLLNPRAQALFNASFIQQASSIPNYRSSMGFGSNEYFEALVQKNPPRFLMHGGFVLGAESKVVYHYNSDTTIMIVSDFSAHYRNRLPALMVTAIPYFNFDVMIDLAMRYATLFPEVISV